MIGKDREESVNKRSKTSVLLILGVLFLAFILVYTSNKSISFSPIDGQYKNLSGERLFVERNISNNLVELNIFEDSNLHLNDSEVVLVSELLDNPSYSINVDSITPRPYYADSEMIVWLFAKNAPQQVDNLTASEELVYNFRYSIDGNDGNFSSYDLSGKWALLIEKNEGLISDYYNYLLDYGDYNYTDYNITIPSNGTIISGGNLSLQDISGMITKWINLDSGVSLGDVSDIIRRWVLKV